VSAQELDAAFNCQTVSVATAFGIWTSGSIKQERMSFFKAVWRAERSLEGRTLQAFQLFLRLNSSAESCEVIESDRSTGFTAGALYFSDIFLPACFVLIFSSRFQSEVLQSAASVTKATGSVLKPAYGQSSVDVVCDSFQRS
jgi:hypothetical protein